MMPFDFFKYMRANDNAWGDLNATVGIDVKKHPENMIYSKKIMPEILRRGSFDQISRTIVNTAEIGRQNMFNLIP